jgi:hypothetical protein
MGNKRRKDPNRLSWLDDDTDLPVIDEHVEQLEHFTQSMADGRIDKQELARQLEHLTDAMKAVEDELDDDQHEKVTHLLVELTAYNVMQLLHELANERARQQWNA